MNCLYCDKKINKYSLYSLFIEEDMLCIDCRKLLNLKKKTFYLDKLRCESIYEYDSLFKTLLLQYKECYDEALKSVFLYRIDIYIRIKYIGYKIVYVPSSEEKLKIRGFNHLKEIFRPLGFKEVEGLKKKEELVQEGKGLNDRKKMMDNYYYEGEYIDRLLIVDDVCTTGSSLIGIYNAFKGKTGKIRAFVLANAFNARKGFQWFKNVIKYNHKDEGVGS